MEIRQVQYALAVAEVGSFSTAAEDLYISQSSLSKQIIALEQELGFQLFDRSKRKIALTPAGNAFVLHAREIDEAYRAMMAELREYRARPSLAIVAIPVIAQYGIASYVAEFRRKHPDIDLALEEREASTILPALDNHQFDLAFVRDNYLDKTGYVVREIASDRFCVVASNQHRFAGRSSMALAELANENFIVFDKGTVVHELAVDACRSAGFEPRIFYASLRIESILGLVASNVGVALMMERVVDYHRHPEVVVIALEESIASSIVLVAPKAGKQAWPARVFVEFMDKALAHRCDEGSIPRNKLLSDDS